MNEIQLFEDQLKINILLYDIDIVDGKLSENLLEELCRKTKKLEYNNHICCVINVNAVFHSFRCPKCDTFFNRTINLERNLTTCFERVKHVYSSNRYQLRENLIDKLDSFGIKYTTEQKFFKNLAKLNFESNCV